MAGELQGQRTQTDLEWEQECMRWRGRILTGKFAHYCLDWDGLPIDESDEEFKACHCGPSPSESE